MKIAAVAAPAEGRDDARMDDREPHEEFVGTLVRYARERDHAGSNGARARAALADLRAGLTFTPGGRARMARYVGPWLVHSPTENRWLYVVAALLAMSPENRGGGLSVSMGAAFRTLYERRDSSPSVEQRLLALLSCRSSALPVHLRGAVSLLDSNDVQLDWSVLLHDLLHWGDPERSVQDRWLRQYYSAASRDEDADETQA